MVRISLIASVMVAVSVYASAQEKRLDNQVKQPTKQESKKEGEPAKASDKEPRKYLYERIETAAKNAGGFIEALP